MVLQLAATSYPSKVAQGITPRLREDSKLLNFNDSLCVTAIFGVCNTIVLYQAAEPVECSDEILKDMYEAIIKLMNSRSSKTSLEALKFGDYMNTFSIFVLVL
jgi:hypothetical protein